MTFTPKPRKAYDSTAYQETRDRLKVPRTKWVFNKQDSTYAVPDTHRFCLERGRRQYELTNHTADVLATITDRKIPVDSDPDSLVDFYRADIITADDYYPFGMQMPSRHWQTSFALADNSQTNRLSHFDITRHIFLLLFANRKTI